MNVTVTNAQNRVIVNDDTNVVTVQNPGTTVTVAEPGPQGPAGAGGADGYYGQFYDTTDQLAASTTLAYPVKLNSVDAADGVSVEANGSGDPTRITFGYQGTYNVQFSLQFVNTDSQDAHINIWFRLDGTDVADSNSQYTVPQKHGSDNGALIAALNLLVDVTANQYVEIMWQTENTAISLQTLPAGTTPTTPATPSAIVTATQVMYTQVGPAGPGVATGGTTGQVLTKSSATNYDTAWATPTVPGTVLVKSEAIGSGVAVVQVTSCFSATYDTYQILIVGVTPSASNEVLRIRVLFGTTPAASGWYGNTFYVVNGAAGGLTNANVSNANYSEGGSVTTGGPNSIMFNCQAPFREENTRIDFSSADSAYWRIGAYVLRNTTSYDGFQFAANIGTLTGGTVYVYGYKK